MKVRNIFHFLSKCSNIKGSERRNVKENNRNIGRIDMVRHLILWKLKESLTVEEKNTVLNNMKEHLEGLVGIVPGLVNLKIVINKMESSNADVMLDSVLESEEALKGYQGHPAHVEVANTYVRPFTEVRMCIDYKE